MRQLIDEELKNFERKFSVIYLKSTDRDRLLDTANREIGHIAGKWRNKQKGTEIALENYFIHTMKSGNYSKTKNFTEAYISPFRQRSQDTIAKHKIEMKRIILDEIDNSRLIFTSETAKAKFLDVIAEDFLATDSPDGIKYHKLNNNSIPSVASWTLADLINELGVKNTYLDNDLTEITRALHAHELKETALKMTKDARNEAELNRNIERVRKAESTKLSVGRSLTVDEFEIKAELKKKLINYTGKTWDALLLPEQNVLLTNVSKELDALNSLQPISEKLSQIEIKPQPQAWDGLN